ncbi:hypothetical protein TURU_155767 [Turdus rufiventris]|nr:hypothetical protein TURU_155767 [Turdus rufiventris]
MRMLGIRKQHILPSCPKLPRVYQYRIRPHTSRLEKHNENYSNSNTVCSWTNQELCTAQAEALQDRNPAIIITQLTGEGAFAVPTAQSGYQCDVYDIITRPALQALRRLPGMGIDSKRSFAKILQGPAELFVQFLDRLQATLSQQVNNDEARAILLWQLAFTKVYEDCRKALLSVCNLHTCDIADIVGACQNVGTVAYNTKSLAVALATYFQVSDMQARGCF